MKIMEIMIINKVRLLLIINLKNIYDFKSKSEINLDKWIKKSMNYNN